MLLFTILGFLLVACIIGAIVWFGDYDTEAFGGASLFIGLIDLIVLICLISDVPFERNVKYDIAKYEELKTAVEQVNNMSSELKPIAQKELFEDVYKMNTYIDKNATYYDSWWVGWLYSEEIGKLEKINYVE